MKNKYSEEFDMYLAENFSECNRREQGWKFILDSLQEAYEIITRNRPIEISGSFISPSDNFKGILIDIKSSHHLLRDLLSTSKGDEELALIYCRLYDMFCCYPVSANDVVPISLINGYLKRIEELVKIQS